MAWRSRIGSPVPPNSSPEIRVSDLVLPNRGCPLDRGFGFLRTGGLVPLSGFLKQGVWSPQIALSEIRVLGLVPPNRGFA